MNAAELDALVDHYLPVLVTAGDFGRTIQSRVQSSGQKSGPNAWAEAVTDADLAIQGFFEVATLAHDSQLGFVGEESAQSSIARYFNKDAATVIYLDPVNGTFLYQSQQDNWDIILNIAHAGRLLAAISYMPVKGQFYLAVEHHGALTGLRDTPSVASMRPLHTQSGSRVCLTYQAPDVVQAIGNHYEAYDVVADYRPGKTVDNLNELFTGRLDAFACHGGDLLDWGAMGYIVSQAGGVCSRLDGTALDGLQNFSAEGKSDMLVSASPAVHREILSLLN
ncbi:MAG: inositol monophosphatase family protein [Gammaproteobacteria bacterium]